MAPLLLTMALVVMVGREAPELGRVGPRHSTAWLGSAAYPDFAAAPHCRAYQILWQLPTWQQDLAGEIAAGG